ncbi:hypothetical protein LF817_16015 [Halobacillus sp. A1]|uniref:hypothetical protein n=1 Tax=Halobacillus sp. A1 TaxID=2880262 RepID=UPI0020A62743|nr:hypothetical protein [Halobacillus sp. A1]MCP3032832.1 hypothetical protein [Halobacillus sp. A1]
MKKANVVFIILSGLLIFQNFIISIGGIMMGGEHIIAILMLGIIPLIIWIALLVLSQKKKENASFTLPVYLGLTVLFGIHFYFLTTDLSYGFSKILSFFGM